VVARFDHRLLGPLVNRFRALAGLPLDGPNEQWGRFTTHVSGDAVEVRARILPTRCGPRVVLDLTYAFGAADG
jgi:type II secretory ATPase GspE/PulE/Tfp pilus assembly ATPase PilB-like protein